MCVGGGGGGGGTCKMLSFFSSEGIFLRTFLIDSKRRSL